MLEAGAPHDVINNNGNTPLHLALLDGFWETGDLLVRLIVCVCVCECVC